MTTTDERPCLRYEAMKTAYGLVKDYDVRDPNDDTKRFQVTPDNWRDIYTQFGLAIPDIITGFDDETGAPILNGSKRNGETQRRTKVQSVAKIVEAPDGATTITCKGPCGQTMPTNKFPTLKKGGRGSVCRACDRQGRLDRKAGRA